MARLIDIKCPKCSAPLPISADAQTVTCRYCGGTSVVERPGQHAEPPAGTTVVRVPAQASGGGGALAMTIVMVLVMGLGGVIMALRTVDTAGPGAAASLASQVPGVGQLLGGGGGLDFSDRPMLADVDGDGTLDILGKSRGGGAEYIAAYNGRDGKELWRTDALTKDAAEGGTLRGVALGRVISVDALGKVQAYDLKSGKPSWSALLGEKAESMCEGDGQIVIETADKERHGLDPVAGKKSAVAKGAACKPVFSSERDVTPGYRMIGWWDLEEYKLPGLHDTEGIAAHRALVPSGPGPRFLLGGRDKGTSVAMVVALDEKKEILWKDVVPGVDPLTTDVNVTTQEAAYVDGKLIVPYEMKDHDAGTRMACFDANTGARLWDVHVLNDQVSSGLAVTPERVYMTSWGKLVALSLKTGEVEFSIGR